MNKIIGKFGYRTSYNADPTTLKNSQTNRKGVAIISVFRYFGSVAPRLPSSVDVQRSSHRPRPRLGQ